MGLYTGIRDIPISDELVRLLQQWKLQSKYSNSDDLVFTNKKRNYVSHDNLVKREFKPVLLSSGVRNINWHVLRHYAISSWIEAGLSPKTVQTFASHSSLQITFDLYGHLFPSPEHRQVMSSIFAEHFENR